MKVVIGLILGTLSFNSIGCESELPKTSHVEYYRTTAAKLYQDFETDEENTISKIGGNPIIIKGEVIVVDKDLALDVVVRLNTDTLFGSIKATMLDTDKHQAIYLSRGDNITLECESIFSRINGNPILSNCKFHKEN